MCEPLVVMAGSTRIMGEFRPGSSPTVVLLHSGVSDRRSWRGVIEGLPSDIAVVAYDRRGYGETAPSVDTFTHVGDLLAVLDEIGQQAVWLVGSSMGGGLALDTALSAPARVAGLVLLAPAVSGTPEPTIDPVTMAMFEAAGEAAERGDLDEVNRLETWLWLDGPNAPEGRVSGPARELSLEMNRVVLANGVPEDAGDSGIDAWARIGEIDVPAITAWGDLDVPFLVARTRELADRLPRGEHRVLHGMAHLPYLEDPATVAQIVTDALAG